MFVCEAMESQKRAIQNYRNRLSEQGWVRFEVLGRPEDKDLLRALARKLGQNDEEAAQLRRQLERTVSGSKANVGGVLAALRRSPLSGEELFLERERSEGRKLDL